MWWATAAMAGEGMWLPEQMPALSAALQADGIQLAPDALADPRREPLGAVVGLGFCTASFVSPDGLLLTNAHCAEEYLARSATDGVDRVARGFTAADRKGELSGGPGARLGIVESITDVTAQIRPVIDDPKIADSARVAALDRARSALVARCEKQPGRRCEVVSRFGGQTWQLVQSLELRDVRVVYSPPGDVAFFGGDADNWAWPRHAGDFAVLRAYVAPDGKPADPGPKNVPYHPPHWLRASFDGVKPGDPVVVAGYPGSTERYELLERLKFLRDVEIPAALGRFAETEALLSEARADPEGAARLTSLADGIANDRKYDEGIRDDLKSETVVAVREAIAARIDARAADPAHEADQEALAELRRIEAEREAEYPTWFAVGGLLNLRLLTVADTAYRWSVQRRVKPDSAREPGLQDRDRDDLVAEFDQVDAGLWLPFERAYAAKAFDAYAALPAAQRIQALDGWLAQVGGPSGAVDRLFASPALTDAKARRALLDQPAAALERSTDPWVRLAVVLEKGWLADARARGRTRAGAELRDRPRYVQLLLPEMGDPAYPDADDTLRITFGKVVGYAPRDGLAATPQTRLAGVLEKQRAFGYPWPDALRAAASDAEARPDSIDRRWLDPALGDVPVDFLSDVDTTGGNSGSPTLDARGNLVGLVFDGNYESMTADWQFDAATTRSIHVDLRFVGWLLAQDPAAGWILAELFPSAR